MGQGWSAFLLTYLLGGLTFLPLVALSLFLHAIFFLPHRADTDPEPSDKDDPIVQPGDDLAPLEAAKTARKDDAVAGRSRSVQESEVAAGYFAVCREYTPMGINAKPIERPTPVGSATVAAPSQSVYQTMYRSIFDRKQPPGPLENKNAASQRPKNAGNVFYVVLRHGHLLLFDDEEQLEVRHVVSLAHHDIGIYSGGDITPEGELFIKRNALCLSRRHDGHEVGPDGQLSKPFYLFSEDSSAKEDFYFALLRNQEQYFEMERKAPKPVQFDVKNIITLVQKLHSSEDHVQTRWLNAMIGRIFLGIYQTADIEHFIREKLTKKIARVKRPSFLTNIVIRKIDTGESAPVLLHPRHKDLNVEGECAMEADVKYNGNCRIEVAATARIDLGSRFKVREVNLVLAVVLHKLEGHVFFKIKPPPSNRVWFSFASMPKMEMSIEPIVSTRQITYTVILRQIENRIKEVIAETLVQPFWDDIPFFNTEHKKWRGGIWQGDDAVVVSKSVETNMAQEGDVEAVDALEEAGDIQQQQQVSDLHPIEKSYSAPLADNAATTGGLFGRKIAGKSGLNPLASLSTSIDKGSSTSLPRTLRSPSVSSPSDPVVQLDSSHADVFKPSSSPPDHVASMMAALSARSQAASSSSTPIDSPTRPASVAGREFHRSSISSSSRDPADREMDLDKTPMVAQGQGRRGTASSSESVSHDGGNNVSTPSSPSFRESLRSNTGSLRSNTSSITKGLFGRREAASDSAGQSDLNDAGAKRNTLAAVANAATQARAWGWNAIQRHKEGRNGFSEPEPPVDLKKPMGRGRPLPPPGTPLPPPDKNAKVTLIQIPPKRRPVPAVPDRNGSEESIASKSDKAPPLPSRRRRERTEEEDDNGGDNVLIIPAPVESESGPGNDDTEYVEPTYSQQPWADDPPTGTESEQYNSSTVDDNNHHGTSVSIEEPAPFTERATRSVFGPEGEDTAYNTHSPIEALPAGDSPDEEDDDDISGWLDNEMEMDKEEQQQQTGEGQGTVVSGATTPPPPPALPPRNGNRV